jgi:hypothetical protein
LFGGSDKTLERLGQQEERARQSGDKKQLANLLEMVQAIRVGLSKDDYIGQAQSCRIGERQQVEKFALGVYGLGRQLAADSAILARGAERRTPAISP